MVQQLRKYFIRNPSAERSNLHGRTYLVTGASVNSLGYATAKILLQWGAEVTVTSRSNSARIVDALKAELPTNCHSHLYAYDLDISSAESTKAFARRYVSERKNLDVLINNAGIHLDLLTQWTEPKMSNDQYEIQWRTNYLGSLHLTHLLLPLLRQSAAETNDARIVNVVSMLHTKGSNSEFFNPTKPYNSWNAYGQSKLALMHYTMECQRRFAQEGLQSYCLHPGSVYTNVAGKGLAGNPVIETLRKLLAPVEKFSLKTPEEGAQTSIHCATSPRAIGGKYYRNCREAIPSVDVLDESVTQKLWLQGEQWLATLEL